MSILSIAQKLMPSGPKRAPKPSPSNYYPIMFDSDHFQESLVTKNTELGSINKLYSKKLQHQ